MGSLINQNCVIIIGGTRQVKTTDNGRRSRGDMLRTEFRILPAGIQLPVLGVVSTTAVGFTIKLRT